MSFAESFLHKLYNPNAMVPCCVFGEETFAGRGDVRVSNVGENLRGAAIAGMEHNAHAELISGAFEANCDHLSV
jgi:hypothetical protein